MASVKIGLVFAVLLAVVDSACVSLNSPPVLREPDDFGNHPAQSYETWWLLGTYHLKSDPTRRFSTVLAAQRLNIDNQCNRDAQDYWHFDIAVVDERSRKMSQRSTDSFGKVASSGRTVLQYKDVHILQDANDNRKFELFCGGGSPAYNLTLISQYGTVPMGPMKGFEIDAFHGDSGIAHVDWPLMAATGWISIGAEKFEVEGKLWNQHMWCHNATRESKDFGNGWDWFNANLDNGWALSFTHFRLNETRYTNYSNGNVLVPKAFGELENNAFVNNRGPPEFTITRGRPWVYPRTNTTFYLEQALSVPSLKLELKWRPWIDDEVIVWPDAVIPWWYYEGPADIAGTVNGQPVKGVGFLEAVGMGLAIP